MKGHYAQECTKYDNKEWATGIVTNYDCAGQSLFTNCTAPTFISIRTDAAITVKFNSTSNDGITVSANTEFTANFQFQALYITAAASANVKVFITQ